MPGGEEIQVWFDGECTLCRRSRAWCEDRDPQQRLRFRDFRTTPDDQLPVARSRLSSSMWVYAGGELRDGFAGWRRILAELPGWRWLARITAIPPLSWLGPIGYRLVARWRHVMMPAGQSSPGGDAAGPRRSG